jgi:hypothetical protein
MKNPDESIEAGSEMDLALQRALDAASLRAGDAVSTSSVAVVGEPDPSPVELGVSEGAADGD